MLRFLHYKNDLSPLNENIQHRNGHLLWAELKDLTCQ